MIVTVTNFFDVWGNARDGWEVNNQCHADYKVRKFDIHNRAAVLRFLKRIQFLGKAVRLASITWEETDRGYYLEAASNGCPICEVRVEE